MHRTALRLPSCSQPSFSWYLYNIHVRLHSSASSVPLTISNTQAIQTLEPWQDSCGKAPARKEEDGENIMVDDLPSTLEAHRASNRAAVIRKLKDSTNLVPTMLRPMLRKDGDGSNEIRETKEWKEIESLRMWPADSVQAKKRYGTKDSRVFVKSGRPLEYTGIATWPKRPWRINDSSKDMLMQRPWLAYIETTSEDYLERFVLESREERR